MWNWSCFHMISKSWLFSSRFRSLRGDVGCIFKKIEQDKVLQSKTEIC